MQFWGTIKKKRNNGVAMFVLPCLHRTAFVSQDRIFVPVVKPETTVMESDMTKEFI